MGLITYQQINNSDPANANIWNERFAKIHDTINGNLTSENIANAAITEAKIADNSITSRKLGFQQYTDNNGWLVTDLGLVKLATKRRTWNFGKKTSIGHVETSNFTGSDNMNPEGFSASNPYNIMWNISGNQSRFLSYQVDDEIPQPNHKVKAKVLQRMNQNAELSVHTWVIF